VLLVSSALKAAHIKVDVNVTLRQIWTNSHWTMYTLFIRINWIGVEMNSHILFPHIHSLSYCHTILHFRNKFKLNNF
jgi:hypothetical protein